MEIIYGYFTINFFNNDHLHSHALVMHINVKN